MNSDHSLLYWLGHYGPHILYFMSVATLWNKKGTTNADLDLGPGFMLFYLNLGAVVSMIVNVLLKSIIQQPRPLSSSHTNLALVHQRSALYRHGIPFDLYGMPSGHAQMCAFLTVFIYLATRNLHLILLYLLLTVVTAIQTVSNSFHTSFQFIVGLFVGSIIACGVGWIASRNRGIYAPNAKKNGAWSERPDDGYIVR